MKRILAFLLLSLFLQSCLISNPQPEDCEIKKQEIVEIKEGTSYDIVFYTSDGERFYINRGLEQGLEIEALTTQLIGKKATFHLAKVMGGLRTSDHIAQLALEEQIIFTEFN